MNRWECEICGSPAVGVGGGVGLRAIGWYFALGPKLYCPLHHPYGAQAAERQAHIYQELLETLPQQRAGAITEARDAIIRHWMPEIMRESDALGGLHAATGLEVMYAEAVSLAVAAWSVMLTPAPPGLDRVMLMHYEQNQLLLAQALDRIGCSATTPAVLGQLCIALAAMGRQQLRGQGGEPN